MTIETGMLMLGHDDSAASFGKLRVASAAAAPWWEEPNR